MQTDCTDVCELMIDELAQLGFVITDDENHDDILDALSKCRLVREDSGSFIIIDWNRKGDCFVVTVPDTGEALILDTRKEAEAKAKELCAWEWKVVAI